ncbi:MAG: DUF58 domain-containing protein, partial [Deltaproteobacteria bacterium]|nr:DUF58 domain-containing protein [Deltaproteobacteria bacterium]
ARRTLRVRLRPRGVRFSFAGSILLLFTGTLGLLMFRFPSFHSIKLGFALFFVVNLLFFLRFRERHEKSWFDRWMDSDFFPRKLAFTNEGRFLVLISLGMGFAAVNTGSNMLYLLLGMLLSIVTASGILSELSVRNVSWEAELPGIAVAGTEALFPVKVRNDKRRFGSYSLDGEVLFESEPNVRQSRGAVLKLPPGRVERMFQRVTFPLRGVRRVRAFSLGTSYPFSFFRKSRRFRLDGEVVVVPRGDRDVSHIVFAVAAGFEDNARRPGRGSEFFSVRPMQPGDEWRDLHWKQMARHNRLVVKEYEALTARRVHLRLAPAGPAPADLSHETREEAVELAASLARSLAARGFEVGLLAPGVRVAPVAGTGGTRRILVALARLDLRPSDPGPVPPPASGPWGPDLVLSVDLDSLAVDMSGIRSDGPRRLQAGQPRGRSA